MRVRNPRELGALIRQTRTDRRLSQTELGKLVGVRQAKISELENGQTGVRISLVLQIINALNLSVDITSEHAAAVSQHLHTTTENDLSELDDIANTGLKK